MRARGIAPVMLIASVLLIGGAGLGAVVNREVSRGPGDPGWVAFAFGTVILAFSASGYVVVSRRRGNSLGWLLLGLGTIESLGGAADAYATFALLNRPGSLPGGEMAAWAADFVISGPGIIFGALTFVLLLFPDGRLPGRRWRAAAATGMAGIVLAQIAIALSPGRLPGFRTVENPLGVGGFEEAFAIMESVAFAALVISLVAAAISLVMRFRRSRGVERQQLKWFTTASAFLALAIPSGPIWWGVFPGIGVVVWPLLFGGALAAIPITIGIAILKYRLYDIDVVINKTLVFGALAAFITGIYVAVVVGIGELLGSSEEPNLALSIAATALVAIAFQPVKERVQRVANRIVYGARSTPYEVMANLSRAASGAIEPHDILPSVAAVAASGVGARATRVSLVLHSGETLEATHPVALEGAVSYDVVVALTHRDETIGELAVAKAAGEQLSPGDTKLLEDLAAQAALALHNARLAIELGARLDEISVQARELDASRRRIVSAQDDSRRRLEHDISSGPQRSLEDMRAELGAVKEVLGDDRERAAGQLGALAGRANETLDALRDLARGIFPPLLAYKGIVAALEAHIRKHELDVVLEADEGVTAARFEERVEIAVYFCCLETLSVRRDGTTISLGARDGSVEMSCSDVVLDDARRETIRDRVEALSGTVEFEERGAGSALRAKLPAAVLEVAE